MMLPIAVARGVADGSVTLAFRRWKRQDVRPSQTFRTATGVGGLAYLARTRRGAQDMTT